MAYRITADMPSSDSAGVLTIPSIDLGVPIFDGASDINLNRALVEFAVRPALANPAILASPVSVTDSFAD